VKRYDPSLQKPRLRYSPGLAPTTRIERLTERSVGLVTDQPSDVYELFVTLL